MPAKHRLSVLLGVSLALLLAGCGRQDSNEFYTNWDIAGGCASDAGGDTRPSAAGTDVDVCDAVGKTRWIWVSYAAPWCNSSRQQAPEVAALARRAGQRVTVYKVLTGSTQPFTGANANDIRTWSRNYRLPTTHVLAENSSRVIPQHLLIGPDGRTWYRYIGHLGSDEMIALIDEFEQGERVANVRSLPRR